MSLSFLSLAIYSRFIILQKAVRAAFITCEIEKIVVLGNTICFTEVYKSKHISSGALIQRVVIS